MTTATAAPPAAVDPAALGRRHRPGGRRPGRQAGPRRVVGRRAAGRQHPGVGVPAAEVDPGARGRPGPGAGRHLPAAAAERRRRVEPVPRRAGRHLGHGQGVLRPETDGRPAGRPAHGAGPRADPAAGRGRGVQHVHQVLLRLPGAGQLRQLPVDPAGGRVPAPAGVLQPVQRLGLDADDDPAAGDRDDTPAGSAAAGRAGDSGAVPGLRRRPHAGHAAGGAAAELAGRVPAPGPGTEDLRAVARIPGLRRRAIKAAEKWLLERMATSEGLGRDLPAHGLHADRAAGPGVRRRPPGRGQGPQGPDRLLHPRGGHDPAAAVRVARVGHGHRPARAGRGGADGDRRLPPGGPPAWLLSKECRTAGDWAAERGQARRTVGLVLRVREPVLPRHGRHGHGPDVAQAGWAAPRPRPPSAGACRGCWRSRTATAGWAAFDKTRHREVLEHIPFADHNAMQDPSPARTSPGGCWSRWGTTACGSGRSRSTGPWRSSAASRTPAGLGGAGGA